MVTDTTFRKIARDSVACSDSERVRIKLTVQVEGVDFDPEGETSKCFQSSCMFSSTLPAPEQERKIPSLMSNGIVRRGRSVHMQGEESAAEASCIGR